MAKVKAAIIGSGNIGTDLMLKIMHLSDTLEMGAMVGIDPTSDGLARAARLGVPTTADGVQGLIALDGFDDIEVVFDATSAGAHKANAAALEPYGKQLVDLTPAAIGPYVVPVVNLDAALEHTNVNMVTCGGQATIPVIAAINSVAPVHYAEIVASIASKSAGPGTRANIDEFTETTSAAIEEVGGAARGKAIIVLNPAEPPMIMRDTVLAVTDRLDEAGRAEVRAAVTAQVARVAEYVPGYRLKQDVQFLDEGSELDVLVPTRRRRDAYTRISVFLEVQGAAMYLPEYAGNLDIMTSAALRTAERLVANRQEAAA
ncbi:acetaldehyde dehydrogenase (acetylating) [Brevibacterium sp. 68QC2CO]|nr:acetaldehyde dehydrogenase (acetylating) [Brevibacterium sp. 68QC2CO]MCQ9385764.1 acetaldehyde dehydrogenase (acetylating) [Brevibacterium sp. 68QC2CO]